MSWKFGVGCESNQNPSTIRIAYIESTAEMGGAEHLLLSLIENLPKDKIHPHLISAEDGQLIDYANRLNISTKVIPLFPFYATSFIIRNRKILNPFAIFFNIFSLMLSASRLRKYLKDAQMDYIQTNSAFAHIYGGLAARTLGLPCIWYFHELVERKRLGGSIAFIWRVLAAFLADRVVGVSNAVIKSLGVGNRGCVIYAGRSELSDKRSKIPHLRAQLGLLKDTVLVGYIGRIAYVKGLDVLAEAARKVVQLEPNTHFVLFGEALFGAESYKRSLRKKITQMKLDGHWHWIGYDPEAVRKIPELDFLVLPSRREALPLILIEAGMASKTVIASRIGGVPEVISDGETGLLVATEDVDELVSAILRLLRNPQLASAMGRQAYKRVTRFFDLNRYCLDFVNLYGSIATRP